MTAKMTSWEKTVMSDEVLEKNIRKDYEDFSIRKQTDEIADVLIWTREAQAELTGDIAFKAGKLEESTQAYSAGKYEGKKLGYAEGYDKALQGAVMEGGYESVKKIGMRTVVEWFSANQFDREHWENGSGYCSSGCPACKLDKQLEDWGIDRKA